MTKRACTILAVAVVAIAAALPVLAQTITLKANIPFEFMVGEKVMPAGQYQITGTGSPDVLRLEDFEAHSVVLAATQREYIRTDQPAAATKLVFNRYGNRYFLAEVVNGYAETGMRLPVTHAERELAKTASLQREEIVVVLARR